MINVCIRPKSLKLTAFTLTLMLLLALASCESKFDPPADHTIRKDGAMHKSGLDQAEVNCISCHGDNLDGGTSGVSCYECHGKKWK